MIDSSGSGKYTMIQHYDVIDRLATRSHIMAMQFRMMIGCSVLLLLGIIGWAGQAVTPQKTTQHPVTIIPQDGFNLKIVEQLSPTDLMVKVDPPVHNWFAGTFTNLPTDKGVTIGLTMSGVEINGNRVDVSKWVGLRPMMTYADPAQYQTYEWFRKDAQGRWVSGDPFKQGTEKFAGTGKVPQQSVIPMNVAEQFLSSDGKYWQPWREVDSGVIPSTNALRIRISNIAYPTITVAMRVPYTYTYLQQFITHLQAAKLPGVFVDQIGITPEKRHLQAVRVEDPTSTAPIENKRTILVIAREHATEQSASWLLQGLLTRLLQEGTERQTLCKDTTWIFIPIQDPDGSANSTFDHLTEWMCHAWDPKIPHEMFDYAHYLTDYVNAGRSIDLALSIHNVEANESPNIYSPFADARFQRMTLDFNRDLFQALQTSGYAAPPEATSAQQGWMNFRLYGWCALVFGSFDLAYEVNDRYPSARLSLQQVQQMGEVFDAKLSAWQVSDTGVKWHKQVRDFLIRRDIERAKHFKQYGITAAQRNEVDYLVLGY